MGITVSGAGLTPNIFKGKNAEMSVQVTKIFILVKIQVTKY